jgi:hypothetical protein
MIIADVDGDINGNCDGERLWCVWAMGPFQCNARISYEEHPAEDDHRRPSRDSNRYFQKAWRKDKREDYTSAVSLRAE